jgi:hypothetical protein
MEPEIQDLEKEPTPSVAARAEGVALARGPGEPVQQGAGSAAAAQHHGGLPGAGAAGPQRTLLSRGILTWQAVFTDVIVSLYFAALGARDWWLGDCGSDAAQWGEAAGGVPRLFEKVPQEGPHVVRLSGCRIETASTGSMQPSIGRAGVSAVMIDREILRCLAAVKHRMPEAVRNSVDRAVEASSPGQRQRGLCAGACFWDTVRLETGLEMYHQTEPDASATTAGYGNHVGSPMAGMASFPGTVRLRIPVQSWHEAGLGHGRMVVLRYYQGEVPLSVPTLIQGLTGQQGQIVPAGSPNQVYQSKRAPPHCAGSHDRLPPDSACDGGQPGVAASSGVLYPPFAAPICGLRHGRHGCIPFEPHEDFVRMFNAGLLQGAGAVVHQYSLEACCQRVLSSCKSDVHLALGLQPGESLEQLSEDKLRQRLNSILSEHHHSCTPCDQHVRRVFQRFVSTSPGAGLTPEAICGSIFEDYLTAKDAPPGLDGACLEEFRQRLLAGVQKELAEGPGIVTSQGDGRRWELVWEPHPPATDEPMCCSPSGSGSRDAGGRASPATAAWNPEEASCQSLPMSFWDSGEHERQSSAGEESSCRCSYSLLNLLQFVSHVGEELFAQVGVMSLPVAPRGPPGGGVNGPSQSRSVAGPTLPDSARM